jgi:hypothetical protein
MYHTFWNLKGANMKQDVTEERDYAIYAVDFDGTLVENKWPEIGQSNRGVIAYVKAIQERGDKWILWTMRSGDPLMAACNWCKERGLYPDAVNDNLPDLIKAFGNNPRKVYADFYIDDHNMSVNDAVLKGTDVWPIRDIYNELRKWNKDQDKLIKSLKDYHKELQRHNATQETVENVNKLLQEARVIKVRLLHALVAWDRSYIHRGGQFKDQLPKGITFITTPLSMDYNVAEDYANLKEFIWR